MAKKNPDNKTKKIHKENSVPVHNTRSQGRGAKKQGKQKGGDRHAIIACPFPGCGEKIRSDRIYPHSVQHMPHTKRQSLRERFA
jgi:hypothetical protein